MAFATESDLQDFMPDIFRHGHNDFTNDLANAEEDIINLIKSSWYPSAIRSTFIRENTDLSFYAFIPLDVTRLNSAVLKKLTIYRAAYAYIYPKMSTMKDADGDSFSRKSEFYKKMYSEEWSIVKLLALYDFNGDSQFSDLERRVNNGRRVFRA